MNQVYKYCGYSKQAFHQKMDRKLKEREVELLLIPIITELRQEHPGVSARKFYDMVGPVGIGRDKFEALCFQNGLKLSRQRSYRRTTDSTGVVRFPNLVLGREFTAVNQAWVSDITYYQIGKNFYYLTFIMDLFSRTIVGYSVSKRLSTEQTTLIALKAALKDRNVEEGVIFHSDGGGQYYCKDFLELTGKYKMKNSMCEMAYENPHAERINGTIKNQYLKGYNPRNFAELKRQTDRAVNNYNNVRPHDSLKRKTPLGFEKTKPAGGASLTNDNFCISMNTDRLHQKNHHLSKSLTEINKMVKTDPKTVNVIQA
jgi:transposase InsO family protein